MLRITGQVVPHIVALQNLLAAQPFLQAKVPRARAQLVAAQVSIATTTMHTHQGRWWWGEKTAGIPLTLTSALTCPGVTAH
jgi:hypothetical protein